MSGAEGRNVCAACCNVHGGDTGRSHRGSRRWLQLHSRHCCYNVKKSQRAHGWRRRRQQAQRARVVENKCDVILPHCRVSASRCSEHCTSDRSVTNRDPTAYVLGRDAQPLARHSAEVSDPCASWVSSGKRRWTSSSSATLDRAHHSEQHDMGVTSRVICWELEVASRNDGDRQQPAALTLPTLPVTG